MFQQSNNDVVLQNILFGFFKCSPTVLLAKSFRTAEKPRHKVASAPLAFLLEALLKRFVPFSILDHLSYSPCWSVPGIVHVSVVRYIPCHGLADLVHVRVCSLNFQVVPEVKMRIVKYSITNCPGCTFNDHWVRRGYAFVIKIFSSSCENSKAKENKTVRLSGSRGRVGGVRTPFQTLGAFCFLHYPVYLYISIVKPSPGSTKMHFSEPELF